MPLSRRAAGERGHRFICERLFLKYAGAGNAPAVRAGAVKAGDFRAMNAEGKAESYDNGFGTDEIDVRVDRFQLIDSDFV
jgi:hypothetical protein